MIIILLAATMTIAMLIATAFALLNDMQGEKQSVAIRNHPFTGYRRS